MNGRPGPQQQGPQQQGPEKHGRAVGRRIFANVAALGGSQLVTMACGVVTSVVLARALGPGLLGVLGFAAAVVSYFGLFVNMGMDVHAVREIPRAPARGRALARMVLSTRFLLALAAFAVLVALAPHVGRSAEVPTVLIIQGAGLFAVALTLDFFYQAEQRMAVAGLRQGAAALAGALAVLMVIRAPSDLHLAAAIPVGVHMISALALLFYFWTQRAPSAAADSGVRRLSFIRRAAPVALMGVLITIYINLDIIILGYMVNQDEVGLYVAASRVAIMAAVIASLVHSAFLPALAKAFGDDAACSEISGNQVRVVGLLGGAIGGFGILLAPQIIEFLFGESFAGASLALTILMFNVVASYMAAAFGTPLLAWQCDKGYTAILIAGAALNVGLNILLIPHYGIEGAAAATLATQTLIWLSLMALAHKAFGLHHYGLITKTLSITALSLAPFYAIMAYWPAVGTMPALLALVVFGTAYLTLYGGVSLAAGLVAVSEIRGLLRRAA